MKKLPEIKGTMPLAQYTCLELLHILVDVGILPVEAAVERYQLRKTQFGNNGSYSWI